MSSFCSFCSAKATHIFSAINIRILYIESAKTVNKMTFNELVKLTTLWTTGPWTGNSDQTVDVAYVLRSLLQIRYIFYLKVFLLCLLLAWRDIGTWFSILLSVCSSVNICVKPSFDPYVQDHFLRTIKASVMMLGISLHLGITTQTAVSIFELNLYFTVHRICKFAWRNIAFNGILVTFFFLKHTLWILTKAI